MSMGTKYLGSWFFHTFHSSFSSLILSNGARQRNADLPILTRGESSPVFTLMKFPFWRSPIGKYNIKVSNDRTHAAAIH